MIIYNNVEDVLDKNENYIKVYYVNGEKYVTKSYNLWCGITDRLNTKNYIDVTNGFTDYQEFAVWCNNEYGYRNIDEKGNLWCLDKDILTRSRTYSKDTCIFVPSSINLLFTDKRQYHNKYPRGFSWHKEKKKFRSYCQTVDRKQKHLGYYDDIKDCHKAWQRYFSSKLKEIIRSDNDIANDIETKNLLT